jgi:hypothetical protein
VGGVLLCVLAACGGGESANGSGGGSNAGNTSAAPPTATTAGYFAQAGKIFDGSGQEIQVRGVSHHGFNSDPAASIPVGMGWNRSRR